MGLCEYPPHLIAAVHLVALGDQGELQRRGWCLREALLTLHTPVVAHLAEALSFAMSTPPRASHRGAAVPERMRERIVQMVEQEGVTQSEVARLLGVHRNTVRNIIAHFHETGHHRVEHTGGPSLTYNDQQLERLWDIILERPKLNARALIREMGDDAPAISERTMQRHRHVLYVTPRTGRIAAGALFGNHTERSNWAWENRRRPVATWLHSDESTLCMRDTGDIVWCPEVAIPAPLIEVQLAALLHVHIWGVVWDTGRIFQLYDGHLTAAMYVDLLEQYILPEKENLGQRVSFCSTATPAHTAKCNSRSGSPITSLKCKVLPTHSPSVQCYRALLGLDQEACARARPRLASYAASPRRVRVRCPTTGCHPSESPQRTAQPAILLRDVQRAWRVCEPCYMMYQPASIQPSPSTSCRRRSVATAVLHKPT